MNPTRALRRSVGWVGVPFYAAAVAARNRLYDAGVGVVRLPLPVISVGNLSTGGTGKTPLVAWLARQLLAAGHRPVIALRGYRGDGRGGSDEADEYRRSLTGVPLAVGADRVATIGRVLASPEGAGATVVLLDDGFQHRRIARALDVLVVDATRPPDRDRLLPVGDLREPAASAARVGPRGGVVITRADLAPPGAVQALAAWARATAGAAVAVTRHTWAGLRVLEGNRERHEVAAWLRGRRALVLAAIGNGAAFAESVRVACGAGSHATPTPVEALLLRDHDPYRPATVARAQARARAAGVQAIVTTEKDWSKLSRHQGWPCPVVVPRLALAFDEGEAGLVAAALAAAGGRPGPGEPGHHGADGRAT